MQTECRRHDRRRRAGRSQCGPLPGSCAPPRDRWSTRGTPRNMTARPHARGAWARRALARLGLLELGRAEGPGYGVRPRPRRDRGRACDSDRRRDRHSGVERFAGASAAGRHRTRSTNCPTSPGCAISGAGASSSARIATAGSTGTMSSASSRRHRTASSRPSCCGSGRSASSTSPTWSVSQPAPKPRKRSLDEASRYDSGCRHRSAGSTEDHVTGVEVGADAPSRWGWSSPGPLPGRGTPCCARSGATTTDGALGSWVEIDARRTHIGSRRVGGRQRRERAGECPVSLGLGALVGGARERGPGPRRHRCAGRRLTRPPP